MRHLKNYRKVVGKKVINRIYSEAEPLIGKKIVNINSTSTGGGVAELLDSLIPLFRSAGVDAVWEVIHAPKEFFVVTKKIHNALQGEKISFSYKEKKLYLKWNEINSKLIELNQPDMVVTHDPQPLPLINFFKKKQPWIWRCHIDLTSPYKSVWNYTKRFIKKYNGMIISHAQYKKRIISEHLIMPSINPLSRKNRHLSDSEINKILLRHHINMDKPIVAQISRFDKWKDPIGVIEAFKLIRKKYNCQLVLLGNMAKDDPEGAEIYEKIVKSTREKDINIRCVDQPYENDFFVNALQRAASVVIQKSLKEGFALTVSEALWKGTPVVGSNVGGIPLQIINGKNGFLVNNIKECAQKTIWLLKHHEQAAQMGKYGKKRVREKFLITRHLLDYIMLFKQYIK